jgi:drug/metabolite transporter (DMT)-like permease
LVSAVLAYPSGIVAVRRLGSSLASFVSLTEVIFAVVFAFVLLGQRPVPIQLLGGALILAGIALVQRPSRSKAVREPAALTAYTADD